MKKGHLALAIAACFAGLTASVSAAPLTEAQRCEAPFQQKANDLRIYQVMVESFVDGDPSIGHGTGYGTSHHNGDLQGVIDSLDYIKSLGMNAIWLTPVFHSIPVEGQNHWADRLDATGYFASDYFSIDPRFGTLEKAKELVDKAHAKGLYVFFDGVFGHHKGNVKPSPSGLLPAGESNPVSYPESLAFYKEVATWWVKELGIDGWRLDQAYQVPVEYWQEIRSAVEQASQSVTYKNPEGENVHPLGYMVAEIWNNEITITGTGYGSDDQPALCSAFDFPMRYRVLETFAVNESGVGGRGGDWLSEGMDLHSVYPAHAQPNLMLANHDVLRPGDLLQRGNIANPDDAEYWQRLRAAYSFLGAYTGPITLYYGEEIGDEVPEFAQKWDKDNCAIQGYCDDHVSRTSARIDGVTAELNPDQAAFKTYIADLMKLREKHNALSEGQRTAVVAEKGLYVDHKASPGESLLYAVSTQKGAQTLALTETQAGSSGVLRDLLSGEQFEPVSGKYTIPMKGWQARYLLIEKPGKLTVADKAKQTLTGDGFLAQCDNPVVEGKQPQQETLYVVGDFADSGWKHIASRQFSYRGNNTYQAVIDENAGAYKMQFAASSWNPQFTADGLTLKPTETGILKKGGYGQDTAVTLPESGRYVWNLQFTDTGLPKHISVFKCQ